MMRRSRLAHAQCTSHFRDVGRPYRSEPGGGEPRVTNPGDLHEFPLVEADQKVASVRS